MKVLITGATGFLGGALARALVREGTEVHALARPSSDRSILDVTGVTWHEGDVTVPQSLNGAFARVDWIVHASGRLGEAGVAEQVYQRVNVEGTRNVLRAAAAAGKQTRVLHLSSPGVLGVTGRQPVPEDTPYSPRNPYERSKAGSEQVAREFAARGFPVVIARPGFIYGPGDHHVLPLFQAVQRGQFFYIGGGEHLCQPTFIADAVAGMVLCLKKGRPGIPYHITGPRPVTFRELGEAIASALGVRAPWFSVPRWAAMAGATGIEALGKAIGRKPPLSRAGVDFFSRDRVFSSQRAHEELGYKPQYDLEKGVGCTVAWYRERGWV